MLNQIFVFYSYIDKWWQQSIFPLSKKTMNWEKLIPSFPNGLGKY